MRSVSVAEPNQVDLREAQNRGQESCPICSHEGTTEWLKAPDRFHGRKVKYSLVRCPGCSLVWLSNPPQPSEMHLHYTKAYDQLISTSGQSSPNRWQDRRAALAPHKQSGALL